MKKQLISRGLLGFPLGISLGYIITIMVSAFFGKGYYSAVMTELVTMMGNEINAVILQTLLCGILGTGFAMASLIWEIDSWSLAKQSGVYFAIACALMLPIAYITNWMKHTLVGILSYIGIFVLIFIIVWLSQYFALKSRITRINREVKADNSK